MRASETKDMECTSYRDVMLDVLYGEAAPETAKHLEMHLTVCNACREELAAFRRVRSDLGRDTLPTLEPARAGQRLALWPRSLIAAAAAVLLILGAGVARIAQLERRIALQESRHAQELAALAVALKERATPAAVENVGSDALQRFEALLRQSEERQGRVEESLRQLAQRTEAQRRYDLARVSAGLAYLDGRTGQHLARTTELMGHVLQASEQK